MSDDFVINLDGHEIARQAHVAEVIPWMDEKRAEADEALAYKMLYGDLDENQQKVYDMLVDQGILPPE